MSGLTPENSAIRTDLAFEKAVAACTSAEQIKVLMRGRAVSQGLVTRDIYDPNVLIATEAGTQPRAFVKSVSVNGQTHTISGATEQEMLANENALYRSLFNSVAAGDEPARDDRGRFVADEPAKIVESADGMRSIESDLVTRALRDQGIDPEALRDFTAQREQQSWASATEQFKGRHQDWQGGQQNLETISSILQNNPDLMNGDPLEALEAAYNHARENGLLVSNPEVDARDRINEANSFESIREALGRNRNSDSTMFGR